MAEDAPVGVFVVDDQHVFRKVAQEVVAATKNFRVVGEAASGAAALAEVPKTAPDLVLLDVRMPGMNGIETAAHLHQDNPDLVIVLITVEEPPNIPAGLTTCGAATLVRKQDFGPALLRQLWSEHAPPRARRTMSSAEKLVHPPRRA